MRRHHDRQFRVRVVWVRAALRSTADAAERTRHLKAAGYCFDATRPHRVRSTDLRDWVLSAAERRHKVIACCVRMQQPGAELVLRLR
jgi:hypothetical protein